VVRARLEAVKLGHSQVGSEHLLLALLEVQDSSAAWILRCHGWEAEAVRRLLEAGTPDLPLPQGMTGALRRSLRQAGREAKNLGSREIRPIHLMLALLRRERCDASEVMAMLGVDRERVFTAAVDLARREALPRSKGYKEGFQMKLLEQFSEDMMHKAGTMEPVIGREREIETVTKGAFDDAPVELETPLEPLPLNTVVMTTKCRYELYDHYDVRIVEPVIYSRQYPNFGAQVKEALRGIYDEAYGEIDDQRKWARECDYDMQTHYTSARPLQAYTNGRYFSLAIHHGYFDCSIGHDCTETTGFFFDMATGKQVRLDELMNPDNPEAESQFISLLKKTVKAAEAAKPGAEVNVSASSLYSHLIKGKYCAWSLLNDGLNIKLNGLNLSLGIYSLFIPYEELEGILKPECMPVKAAGESNYQFLRIDPADAADEKAEVWLNTQTVAGALDFDGVVDHLWVDTVRANPKVNSGCCWFYGFQMRTPLIFLPQTTDMNFFCFLT